jgi:Helix-turn-helix domain
MTPAAPPPGTSEPRATADDPAPMLSATQVAELLGGDISARTVRAYWRQWGLQAYRIGKHLRWKEHDVRAWIDHHPALTTPLPPKAPAHPHGGLSARRPSGPQSRPHRPAAALPDSLTRGPPRSYTHPGHRPPHSRAHKAAPRVRAAAQGDVRSATRRHRQLSGRLRSALTGPAPQCPRRPEPVKGTRLDRTRPAHAPPPPPATPAARKGQPPPKPGTRRRKPRPGRPHESAESGWSQEAAPSEPDISAYTGMKQTPNSSRSGFRNTPVTCL